MNRLLFPSLVLVFFASYFFKPKASASTVSKETIGFRNNNPGNLRPNKNFVWLGQIGERAGYVEFDRIEHGVRAAYINLRSYSNAGYNTAESIVYRWAPPDDGNHTENYVNYVVRRTGFGRKELLMFDRATAFALLSAIFFFENGREVDESVINSGIDLA